MNITIVECVALKCNCNNRFLVCKFTQNNRKEFYACQTSRSFKQRFLEQKHAIIEKLAVIIKS